MQKGVRLSPEEIKIIKNVIKKYDKDAKIILFGSRVDLNKKGGDIDLLVISKKINFKKEINLIVDLKDALGERKIDLIVTNDISKNLFYELAYEEGVEL